MLPSRTRPGDVIAGRFEIERIAGEGGMGVVYRARMRPEGEVVALKVVRTTKPDERERFGREVRLLSQLDHPAIVRHIDHGELTSGESFLAMEWLEGEDLDRALARRPFSIAEVLALVQHVAGALAAAHARGIVHRDVKPRNIFLPRGDARAAKLLDFGIARQVNDARLVTNTGAMIGTPGYFAPEQARGEKELDARADVFALGCVLFECMTGRPAFAGAHLMAILAKILMEEPPRASTLTPGVPAALDELTARMLAKRPEDRPSDGAAVAGILARIARGEGPSLSAPLTDEASRGLGGREQRLVSLILVSSPASQISSPALETRAPDAPCAEFMRISAAARPYRAHVEELPRGSAALMLLGAGAATDRAAQAARCALAVHAELPEAQVVLVTGRGELEGALPVGEVIDRAAQLLREEEPERTSGPRTVRLDQATAGLLAGRFEIAPSAEGPALVQEMRVHDGERRLLGRPTPFVGRERETAGLAALFEECVEESSARGALITGAAGIGKSRLRQEFVRRLGDGGQAEVWLWQGDAARIDAPLGLIIEMLRRATSLRAHEPLEARREKIQAYVARHLHGEDAARVAVFLGELLGAPWPEEASALLEAARRERVLMGEQVQCAFLDLVSAASERRPLVLVLEDLHWSDAASVRLVDAALRAAPDRRLFVLALSRPEVHERFPRLWEARNLQLIRLGELSRRASEHLVRHVLGEGAPAAQVTRVVAQAAGHPFYLEELLRAVAEGQDEALPTTVLAMVEARLEALPHEARRILRVGSVFGEVFWSGAVRALLAASSPTLDVDRRIAELIEQEVLVRRPQGRFPGEQELAFRHALPREASYEALTREDRALAHARAGAWLERQGEQDAAVLAHHFERGGDPARAMIFYARAATQALQANDFTAVITAGDHAKACGAEGALLGEVRQAQAEAHTLHGTTSEGGIRAREAMALLPPGHPLWFSAAASLVWSLGAWGAREEPLAIAEALTARQAEGREALLRKLAAMGTIARELARQRQFAAADALFSTFAEAPEHARDEPIVAAHWHGAAAHRANAAGDHEQAIAEFRASASGFERLGSLGLCAVMRTFEAEVWSILGEPERAERLLLEQEALCERVGAVLFVMSARQVRAATLLARGMLGEAKALLEALLPTLTARGLVLRSSAARCILARVLLAEGDAEGAERAARAAEPGDVAAPPRCSHLVTFASTLLACDRAREALSAAEEATRLAAETSGLVEAETAAWRVVAEARLALGDEAGAREALGTMRGKLLRRAARLGDPARRARFLEGVSEHARALELASRWLGAAGG